MTINRIGSVSLLSTTLRDVTNVQSRLGDLQTQISSGKRSQDFAGLNGQVEQFAQFTHQLRRTDQFRTANTTAIAKLRVADNSLGQLVTISDSIQSLIITGINGANKPTLNFTQQARDLLGALASELNTTFGGSFLFGGTNTNSPPVPDATQPPVAVGIPDDSYYRGSKDDAVFYADERLPFTFPVRADDVAFQKIYSATYQAIQAAQTGDDTTLKAALTLVQDGKNDLVSARTRVNTLIVNTTAVNERLTAVSTSLKGLVSEVSDTDIVKASTEVSSLEAILQATFQVYSRLSQLKLSDFLR